MAQNPRDQALRSAVAREAAKILAEWSDLSYAQARRKAAEKLNVSLARQLPDNREIEQALREYQQLFLRERQPAALRHLRRLAIEAMGQLAEFKPRLCGPVLNGTADAYTPLRLQLFASAPEAVVHKLLSLHIPWKEAEVHAHYSDGSSATRLLLTFLAGGTRVELLILPLLDERNPPLNPVDGRPERGVHLAEVESLAEGAVEPAHPRSDCGT
jgi:hypothetical protein